LCELVIDPGCAESITITVWEYATEACCDGLRFYDGPNAGSPLILDMQFLGAPQTATFYSGKVYVRWSSDYSVVSNGFRVTWSSELLTVDPPIAAFTLSDTQPALGENVSFSANAGSDPYLWQWNFGDGATSTQQNPTHAYQLPGIYTVQLIATNCVGLSDTVEQTLEVQPSPTVAFAPSELTLTVTCGESVLTNFELSNTGPGELLYSLDATGAGTQARVLIFNYNAFFYSIDGLLLALDPYSANYNIEFLSSLDPTAFAAQLAQQDVLIFPDMPPSAETDFILHQLRQTILDFVDGGGSIVFCGQEYGGSVLSFSGYWQSGFSPFYISNQIMNLSAHPITAGLATTQVAPYASVAIQFNNPDFVSISSYSGYSWIGYRQIASSKLVYLGSNFNFISPELGQMLHNTLQWCGNGGGVAFSPQSGAIAPGGTQQIAVEFSAESLFAGTYQGEIQIQSNDLTAQLVTLPYTLTVTGTAGLVLNETTVNMGSLMQFQSNTVAIPVSNSGCDTLFVQNITSTHPAFSVQVQELVVPPYQTVYLDATFAPQDTGYQTAHLVFMSNVGADSVALEGYSTGAPVAEITPGELNVTLDCGASATLNLTIANNGLGDLQLQSQATSNDAYNILTIGDISADPYYLYRVEDAIRARFPQVNITRFDGQNLALLPNLLNGKQLVVIPFVGAQPNSHYQQLGQLLEPFLQAGGGVIFTGTYLTGSLNAFGWMQSSGDVINAYGYPMMIQAPGHPLLENVDMSQPIYNDFFGHIFTSPGTESIAHIQGFPHSAITVHSVGSGKVVYFGSVCINHYDNDLDVLENAVKYCAVPSWLEVQPEQLTVPPGGTTTVEVIVDAAQLVDNTYEQVIQFTTNDPLNPFISIPVTLVVDGDPVMSALPSQLSFGILQQFAQKDLSFNFENEGCDALHVFSATIDHPEFEIVDYSDMILPYSEGFVKIRFSPLTPGNPTGILQLVTDAGNFSLPVSGVAVAAPVGSITPGNIEVDLRCDESQTISITLNNSGLGALNYQVGNLQSPRNVLGLLYSADFAYWNSAQSYFRQTIPNLNLFTYNGSQAAQLADSIALREIDVIIVPPISGFGDPVFNAFRPVLQGFIQNGGQVLVLGQFNSEPVEQMGLFELVSIQYTSYPFARVVDERHPITDGLPNEFQVEDAVGLAYFPFGEVRPLIKANGDYYSFLGVRNLGKGNVIYWATLLSNDYPQLAPITRNIFSWMSNPLPIGVDLPTVGGSVAPGASYTIPVHFDGTDLEAGQYSGTLRIYTNDPVNNSLEVPFTLNMLGNPCADFGYNEPPCSGTIGFRDSTLNGATSWYWEFGDGGSSFAQNPNHTYAAEGVYTITFVACNALGCDTLIRPVEIFSIDGPQLATCKPQTNGSCCDFGIQRVQVGFLDHISGVAAVEGYQDFSCTYGTELMAGMQFQATVTTGLQLPEEVRGWIDLNNNGVFTNNELIFSGVCNPVNSLYFTVPINAVRDVPLRMRFVSEQAGANPALGPCSDLIWGQCEDYYVVIRTTVNTDEPAAAMQTRIYPNPSAETARLEFTLSETRPVDIRISDAVGRIIWDEILTETVAGEQGIQLPALPAGAYAVSIRSGNTLKVEKWMVVDRP
ncbi:MAG: PKD domain-containing protein, partial [Saprospiraceae bacterium]|nr:PKD domain-containing protein [Saprospiraceae bacterium]